MELDVTVHLQDARWKKVLRPYCKTVRETCETALSLSPLPHRGEAKRIIEEGRELPGHIFNLGHGISPNARVDSVAALIDEVRTYSKKMRSRTG